MILKKKNLKLPIYDMFKILILISDELTQDIVNITKQPSDVEFDGIFVHKKNGVELIIGIDSKAVKPSLVSHECLHATCYILDYVGIPLTEETEEAYTYLLGYLVDEVYKLI